MKILCRVSRIGAAALVVVLVFPSASQALFGFWKKKPQQQPSADAQSQQDSQGTDKANAQMPGMTGDNSNSVKFKVPSASSDSSGATGNALTGSGSAPPPNLPGSGGTNLPSEVVIKGSEAAGAAKLRENKPSLHIDVDPFESIRPSIQPDESLLLADSPFTVSWRRTYPEFLHNERVIQPWRTTFSERPGIVFAVRDQLNETMQRPIDPKDAKSYQWSLTIADEEGRVFQHYEGSKDLPEELVWSGQNDQGEWIKAGRSYSAIYMFTDPGGSPHTKVGKPIQFTGIIHQESDGLHVSLDSTILYGPSKDARTFQKGGENLLRSAADLIKRRYSGIPMRVMSYASTKEVADAQASLVQGYLLKELMLLPQHVMTDGVHAQFSEQRVEIILLNR